MLLELSRVRGPVERVARRDEPSAFDVAGEAYRLVAPVELAFDVYPERTEYRLVGRLRTTLELDCSRCAEPFALPVDTAFDLRYLPVAENTGEGEIEVEEDDLDAAFYRDEAIDLGQMIREQIYLVLPMKPLCAEGCQGLCPECGTNLNTGTCACAPRRNDPRWAGLRALAEDPGGRSKP